MPATTCAAPCHRCSRRRFYIAPKAPPRQKHQPDYGKPRAWYWYPKLYETVVYSEVLNQVRTRRHTFKKLSDGTYRLGRFSFSMTLLRVTNPVMR